MMSSSAGRYTPLTVTTVTLVGPMITIFLLSSNWKLSSRFENVLTSSRDNIYISNRGELWYTLLLVSQQRIGVIFLLVSQLQLVRNARDAREASPGYSLESFVIVQTVLRCQPVVLWTTVVFRTVERTCRALLFFFLVRVGVLHQRKKNQLMNTARRIDVEQRATRDLPEKLSEKPFGVPNLWVS